jgi:hypothetical protein
MRLIDIEKLTRRHGLVPLGSYSFKSGHRVLVGNAGSGFWEYFKQSAEFSDSQSDPLDRWSKRVGRSVADEVGATVVFPFEGPPYPPFLDWAEQTGKVTRSPISISIHHDHGLWHAYRFALEFEESLEASTGKKTSSSPCETCQIKPCESVCPVGAFDKGHYHVEVCMDYLHADAESDCCRNGCVARQACPVQKGNQYLPEHAQFHMKAFVSQTL